jgi:hypothetical protein
MTLPLFDKVPPPPRTCEGCAAVITEQRTTIGLPLGWSGCGTSTKRPGQIAIWCRTCTAIGASTRYVKARLDRLERAKTP